MSEPLVSYTWKSYFVVQADYQLWANDRLFAALGQMDTPLLRSVQSLPYGSIYGTVESMLSESRSWFADLREDSLPTAGSDIPADWDRLIEVTQELVRALQLWLEQCEDAFFERQVICRTSDGAAETLWVRDVLTHMMMRLAHQRGQIAVTITRLGYRSLETDYVYYKREMSAYRAQLAALPLDRVSS